MRSTEFGQKVKSGQEFRKTCTQRRHSATSSSELSTEVHVDFWLQWSCHESAARGLVNNNLPWAPCTQSDRRTSAYTKCASPSKWSKAPPKKAWSEQPSIWARSKICRSKTISYSCVGFNWHFAFPKSLSDLNNFLIQQKLLAKSLPISRPFWSQNISNWMLRDLWRPVVCEFIH